VKLQLTTLPFSLLFWDIPIQKNGLHRRRKRKTEKTKSSGRYKSKEKMNFLFAGILSLSNGQARHYHEQSRKNKDSTQKPMRIALNIKEKERTEKNQSTRLISR